MLQESLSEEYLRTLLRHRGLIALCALAGLALALLLGVRTLPLYRTRTSLDIRSLNTDFMDMHAIAPTGNSSVEEVNTNLQTQMRLLESDTLMQQVVDRMNAQPHPASILRNDLLSRTERLLHLGGRSGIPYSRLVEDASGRVKVKPLGLTRLVEITCDSWDPRFSALFCNTLTSTFEQQDLATRTVEAAKTQQWLTQQVSDVRQRAEDSQRRLEAAVGGNGLMLSQTTESAGEVRMKALQDELVKAEADRMAKQATAQVARGSNPETLPEVQDNPAHRAYELKLADLRSQLTQLVPTFTEQNPKVIRLRAEIADAEAGLRATASSSTGRQSNEFEAAKHREDLLNIAYKAQQSVVSSDLQKSAQVSLLRKELDSEQQLYQTLLQRAKEAGFASAMQAATIRVIDAAKPPPVQFSPRRSLTGAAGLLLGGLLGVGLSFYRERKDHVFRVPGDVPRLLHVRELGVIPASGLPGPGSPSHALSRRRRPDSSEHPLYGAAIHQTRWDDNFSLTAEAYRNATLSILLTDASRESRSYVISSPNSGDGKTTVVSNLGVALSKSRLRVVLIDGDLRRPNLHNAFALENTFGLRDLLRGDVDLETMPMELLTHRTPLSRVFLIPAGDGREDIGELLHSERFGELLARLLRDFDIVLIDSPPALHMADARILAGGTDGVLLVVRSGKTSHEEAAAARDLFAGDGTRLVGTLLNDFNPAAEGRPDYYSSYYRYRESPRAGADA